MLCSQKCTKKFKETEFFSISSGTSHKCTMDMQISILIDSVQYFRAIIDIFLNKSKILKFCQHVADMSLTIPTIKDMGVIICRKHFKLYFAYNKYDVK